MNVVLFKVAQIFTIIFGLLLKANLFQKSSKNRLIWSHWQQPLPFIDTLQTDMKLKKWHFYLKSDQSTTRPAKTSTWARDPGHLQDRAGQALPRRPLLPPGPIELNVGWQKKYRKPHYCVFVIAIAFWRFICANVNAPFFEFDFWLVRWAVKVSIQKHKNLFRRKQWKIFSHDPKQNDKTRTS